MSDELKQLDSDIRKALAPLNPRQRKFAQVMAAGTESMNVSEMPMIGK